MAQTELTGNAGETMDTDTRLRSLEVHAQKTEKDIGSITQDVRALVSMFQGLDKKIEALTASRGPGLGDIVRTASSLVTAFAVLAGLGIWIITSVMAGPFTTLSERQTVIQETVKDRQTRIDEMREELIITKERLRVVNERLESGEFLRGWQATVAYNGKPGG